MNNCLLGSECFIFCLMGALSPYELVANFFESVLMT